MANHAKNRNTDADANRAMAKSFMIAAQRCALSLVIERVQKEIRSAIRELTETIMTTFRDDFWNMYSPRVLPVLPQGSPCTSPGPHDPSFPISHELPIFNGFPSLVGHWHRVHVSCRMLSGTVKKRLVLDGKFWNGLPSWPRVICFVDVGRGTIMICW
jgi:hypothetical protein